MGVAFAAGAITHVLLFIGYGFFRNGVIGNAHLPVYVVVIGFTPIIWRLLGGLRRRRSSTHVATFTTVKRARKVLGQIDLIDLASPVERPPGRTREIA